MGWRLPSSSTAVTEVAIGRSARMVTPRGPRCAPSTECGSWCCQDTTRSISARELSSGRGSVFPVDGEADRSRVMSELGKGIEWDLEPGRPVPRLVQELVQRK